ncbi:MAG: DUF4169 family protein [bacterium]|nr:DUF4169 family protein [bacterium]
MADIINLRQARKAKMRADKAGQADANRAKFGRTKAERIAASDEKDRMARLLDGAQREKDDESLS